MQQLQITPGSLPRIRERRYSGGRPSLDSDKQSRIDTLALSPWLPGERDRYRPVMPPGYVDACPVEASPEELKWRHNCWWATRVKVLASMNRVNLPTARTNRFAQCGGGAWVYQCPKTGSCEVNANNCGDRLCVPCQRARSGVIAAQLAGQMKDRDIRHVVLTMRHTQHPLSDQITRIYQCFSNLRRHKLWKRKVVGGAAFLEIKIGRTGMWHVHLHVLVEGQFINKNALSGAWLAATGDSDIVHIGAVPSRGKVVGYVSKYVTKAIDHTVVETPARLDEAILALRGRRACLTFGSWRQKITTNADGTTTTTGVVLKPDRAPREGWRALGRLHAIIERARAGDAWAAGVVVNLRKGWVDDGSDKTGVQPGWCESGDGS